MERNPGRKDDALKPKWNLMPFKQLQHVVAVLTHGEKKYGADNWKTVEDAPVRYFAAAMRHLTAWQSGERNDPEDGLPHLAHACCCLIFNMWFDDKVDETAKASPVVIRCECGGTMAPSVDIIRGTVTGLVWECNRCHKTIFVVNNVEGIE